MLDFISFHPFHSVCQRLLPFTSVTFFPSLKALMGDTSGAFWECQVVYLFFNNSIECMNKAVIDFLKVAFI